MAIAGGSQPMAYHENAFDPDADARALQQDFEAVGRDLSVAVQRVGQRHAQVLRRPGRK
jgi:hypothetical protein